MSKPSPRRASPIAVVFPAKAGAAVALSVFAASLSLFLSLFPIAAAADDKPLWEAGIGAGKTFHECSLELPGIGLMRCTLQIMYVNESAADPAQRRIGSRFVDLPGLSREQVRSYVARLERAHLASI